MEDLIIRRARLRDGSVKDIAIAGGRIVAVESQIGRRASQEIDAGGRLVAPAFVDSHIHLDKVLVVDTVRANATGTLAEAIAILWEKKAAYELEDIACRAGRVMETAVSNGTTSLRTHVDVDHIGGLRPLQGVLMARERCRDLVYVQVVAFPQEGIIRSPGAEKLMEQALEQGADVVGGMPANEESPADSRKHIDLAFALAKAFNADIDMHVDETDDPFYRTLEMLADKTLAEGWGGRVTAGHTCALAAYDDHYAGYVIAKAKDAGVHFITNPATNLMLQGRLDRQPQRRGITRVKELLAAGINVAAGQDCIKDTFYPFGQADMLEVALITAHAAHLTLPAEIETAFDMVTGNAARILRLNDYGLAVGKRADLVVLDCQTVAEAIRLRPDRRYVLKGGRVAAANCTERQVFRQ